MTNQTLVASALASVARRSQSFMKQYRATIMLSVLLAGVLAPVPGKCQTTTTAHLQSGEISTTGVVTSASASTLVLKTADGRFILFVYGSHVVKPAAIPAGSTVNIISAPRADGIQVAHHITITSAEPGTTPGAATHASGDPIPQSVKDLERSINNQARKYRAGIEAGVGLDPEVILIGVNARLALHKDIVFRPSVDFAFGEVTKMFQINLDGLYRLPLSPRNSRWSAYVGAGPNFSFLSQNFEKAASGDDSIDFSEFDFDPGLNIITGLEYRSGVFYEMRVGVFTTPVVRFMVGYHF